MTERTLGPDFFRQKLRWSHLETAFWLLWVAAFFVPNANHPLLAQVLIWGLFALSLDLLLGYRGIASLGHAAFFGIGAYTAGFLAKYGWATPRWGCCVRPSWPVWWACWWGVWCAASAAWPC